MSDKIIIDAKDKSAGRIATEVVSILTGKNTPSWAPNKLPDVDVLVTNAAKVKTTPTRLRTKLYRRHSGYPGNLKEESLESLLKRKPEEVVKRAVLGMLPKNKLRRLAMANLTIIAGEEKK